MNDMDDDDMVGFDGETSKLSKILKISKFGPEIKGQLR